MFISEAYAQTADAAGAGGAFQAFLPLILIFVVFYFLLIRPQQKKMKQHKEMLHAVRRGDKVITGGGIMGTVTKVDNDTELTVEIAKDVKVKVQRGTISAVVNRTEPVGGTAANDSQKSGGLFGGLFGGLLGGGAKPAQPASDAPQDEPKADVVADNSNADNAPEPQKKDGDKG